MKRIETVVLMGAVACLRLSNVIVCLTQSGNGLASRDIKVKGRFTLKKIFALRGKSNTGKRQTIRTVVEMLSAKQPNATIEHNPQTKVDPRVVMAVNHLKIGIESHGNSTGKLLKETLDSFVHAGCDVIICATRTKGTTIEAVDALPGFEVEWLQQSEQSQPTEQILRNIVMARQIVERVELLSESAEPAVVRALSATA